LHQLRLELFQLPPPSPLFRLHPPLLLQQLRPATQHALIASLITTPFVIIIIITHIT
jgi:hypothetical protein